MPSITLLFGSTPGEDSARAVRAMKEATDETSNRIDGIEIPADRTVADWNEAAGRAQGEFLCLVTQSPIVPTGWLSILLRAFDMLPSVGAAGAMVVNQENRVVEAGQVILENGELRAVNQGLSSGDRRCQFVNDVDCLSLSCLLVRRDTFLRVGGLSTGYLTSSYREADFGLKLSRLDLRLIVCPLVIVCAGNNGSESASAPSGALDADRAILAERFTDALALRQGASEPSQDALRVYRRRGTVAWHFVRTPTWDRDSGALRLKLLLLGLAERRYHVVLVSPAEPNPYLSDLEAHGIETVQAGAADHPAVQAMIRAYQPDAAVFSHADSEAWFSIGCRALSPETVRIMDTVDLGFLRETRQRAVRQGFVGEPSFAPDMLSVAAIDELSSAIRSDVTLVVSSAERDLLVHRLFFDPERVRLVSNVHLATPEKRPWTDRSGFIFLGGYRHPPNVDSILWIVEEIWPLIRQRLPGAWLQIVGSAAPPEVLDLDDRANGIAVVGFVEDHRDVLSRARAMLAPLAYGAGVKGKIGEALAVGTVVVTNQIGAEGMDAEGHVLARGSSPEELADWASRVHEEQDEWNRRSDAGIQIVRERFSPALHVEELISAIDLARSKRQERSFWNLVSRLLWHERARPGAERDLVTVARELRWRGRPQRQQLREMRTLIRALKARGATLELAVSQSAAARRDALTE